MAPIRPFFELVLSRELLGRVALLLGAQGEIERKQIWVALAASRRAEHNSHPVGRPVRMLVPSLMTGEPRNTGAIDVDEIDVLVAIVDEENRIVFDVITATAVFMHPGTGTVWRWQDVAGSACMGSDDDATPAFLRAAFDIIERIACLLSFVDRDAVSEDKVGGDF